MKSRKQQTPEQMLFILRRFRNYVKKPLSFSPQREGVIHTAKKGNNFQKSPKERKQTYEFACEGIERKIDNLAGQIKDLQVKQEMLENQHYQLRKSVRKLHLDKRDQLQERSQMIKKLDQMIDIQLKQEENLNQFKQLFASRKLIK